MGTRRAGSGSTVYATAENWNGESWSVSSLPGLMEAQYALAFSSGNAWVFGRTSRLSIAVHCNGAS